MFVGCSGSCKTNALLNLRKHQQPDIDKIYLYIKDLFNSRYQLLINGREKAGIKKLKNPNAFIGYSQTIDDVYEHLENYNPSKEGKLLTVFYDIIADMEASRKLSPIVNYVVSKRKKTQYFHCFYIAILFQSS